MKTRFIRAAASTGAIAAAIALFPGAAFAQGSTPAATDNAGDTIIVTASGRDRTKLRSSVSVSVINQQDIADFTPRSEAEVFRLIPGIQAQDTAGPGGNSNIGIRGIPVSTGGSEYVQLQEDGLPIVLFGDMNFGNNDYWTRYDTTVDRVEAVRGGGASTFASQGPGAVINYVSNTGKTPGGRIGLTSGVNYNEYKLDFDYGGALGSSTDFNVGGYYHTGHGATHISYNAIEGYQIKANLTQKFDRGYLRLLFKRLDDRAPTYTSAPSMVTLSGKEVTGFAPFPNFDARNQSPNHSAYDRTFQSLNFSGGLDTIPTEGIHVKSTSIGGELHYELSDAFTLDDRARFTSQSGAFRTQFMNLVPTASIIGSTVNGKTVTAIRVATGPNAGAAYTGTYLNNNPNINTNMTDMGNVVNDLTLTGKFNAGRGAVTARAGWFVMRQRIQQDWHINRSYSGFGPDAPQLDLFAGATQLTAAGQAGYNDNWGTCCARKYDLTYVDNAPYLSLNYSDSALDLDASVRFDNVKAAGYAGGGVTAANITVSDGLGSASIPTMQWAGVTERPDYSRSYTSWSIGGLYKAGDNTSLFVRASRGGRFNADRQILGGNIAADGSLTAQGRQNSVNFLYQQEVGIKNRGMLSGGRYNVELAFFRAQLNENNFDFTRINNPAPNNNPDISKYYHTHGLEFSGNFQSGGFRLSADLTWTHSRIVAVKNPGDVAQVGKVPHALPAFAFRISPSYDAGIAAFGVTIDGQTSTYDDDFNTWKIKGQTYFNAFAKVRPMSNLELGLNVNNLFNTLGYRGSGSITALTPTTGFIQNSAVLGRTISASAAFKF